MTAVWCVKHREGWCAMKGGAVPSENADSDETECGSFVIMRIGSEIREPDCTDCRTAMNAMETGR